MRRPAIILGLVLIAVACLLAARLPGAHGRSAGFRATIDYAVDGDTLRVHESDGELAYVRLVGRLSRLSR